MKKNLFLLLFICFGALSLQAQNNTTTKEVAKNINKWLKENVEGKGGKLPVSKIIFTPEEIQLTIEGDSLRPTVTYFTRGLDWSSYEKTSTRSKEGFSITFSDATLLTTNDYNDGKMWGRSVSINGPAVSKDKLKELHNLFLQLKKLASDSDQ